MHIMMCTPSKYDRTGQTLTIPVQTATPPHGGMWKAGCGDHSTPCQNPPSPPLRLVIVKPVAHLFS